MNTKSNASDRGYTSDSEVYEQQSSQSPTNSISYIQTSSVSAQSDQALNVKRDFFLPKWIKAKILSYMNYMNLYELGNLD